jgi:hypothetical protein
MDRSAGGDDAVDFGLEAAVSFGVHPISCGAIDLLQLPLSC